MEGKTGKLIRLGPHLIEYLKEMKEILEEQLGEGEVSLRTSGEHLAKRLDNAGGLRKNT